MVVAAVVVAACDVTGAQAKLLDPVHIQAQPEGPTLGTDMVIVH